MNDLKISKPDQYAKAFQDLWVAGMVGTFFFLLWRSLAQDLLGVTPQFDAYTFLDRLLRYGYLLWLFSYFFLAAIENQPITTPTRRDIVFDVVQSTTSVVAALFLGFVLPLSGLALPLRPRQGAYAGANIAVAITCALSLLLFRKRSDDGVNVLRKAGLVIGLASLVLIFNSELREPSLIVLGGLQVLLWILLIEYARIRVATSA
jgi:hypothetical protein